MLMIFFHHSSKCLYTCVLFNLYLYIVCVLFKKTNVMSRSYKIFIEYEKKQTKKYIILVVEIVTKGCEENV